MVWEGIRLEGYVWPRSAGHYQVLGTGAAWSTLTAALVCKHKHKDEHAPRPSPHLPPPSLCMPTVHTFSWLSFGHSSANPAPLVGCRWASLSACWATTFSAHLALALCSVPLSSSLDLSPVPLCCVHEDAFLAWACTHPTVLQLGKKKEGPLITPYLMSVLNLAKNNPHVHIQRGVGCCTVPSREHTHSRTHLLSD